MAYRPFPFEKFHAIVGGSNWVITKRRTTKLMEQYGEDVICLTPRQYEEAKRLSRMQEYGTTVEHY